MPLKNKDFNLEEVDVEAENENKNTLRISKTKHLPW
jgi:hypothetical protein